MFNKIKNLFKNSKKNQLKKLSLIVEELRQENDARAQEIYFLKKALQECQDNQENANNFDVEDIENRIDDLETKCEYIDDYFDPSDKADQYDLEDLEQKVEELSDNFDNLDEYAQVHIQALEEQKKNDEKIAELKQIKSELKTMFQNIVNALED